MGIDNGIRSFGKYEIVAHLATGGMAEISLARQSGIGGFEKLLVIKRILPHLAARQQFVEMFLDEARIAAKLNHPNIVQIFDLGQLQGQYFIAMEYLEGESLAEVIRQSRKKQIRIPLVLAGGIALQMCEALHFAHNIVGPDGQALQVIHRDINPQNIFILYTGGIKLVDFGIAKAVDRFSHTTTGMLKGKFGYMSPEQIMNLPLDARSDIFSAGVVLWEMLTGRRLYKKSNELEMLKSITEQDPPPPSAYNPLIPPEIDAIAQKALQRARDLRYQMAGEMRLELSFLLKSYKEPSDTVAVGEFMQSLFSDRIEKKRELIKKAKSAHGPLEVMSDKAWQERSDTEPSVSQATPSFLVEEPKTPPPISKKHSSRKLLFLGLSVGGLILIITAVFFSLNHKIRPLHKPKPPEKSLVQPKTEDAPLSVLKKVEQDPVPVMAPQTKKKRSAKTSKEKKREQKAPISNKPGKLRLATQPWTTVYWKGKELGVTPLVDLSFPPGTHTLHMVNQAKDIDRKIQITIKPGETTVETLRF